MLRAIKSTLRNHPWLKDIVKTSVYRMGDLLPVSKANFTKDASPVIPDGKESFFGYHDQSPESPDGKKILLHVLKENSVSILILDKEKKTLEKEYTSSAYNLQLGSRALWLSNDTIIFNDIDHSNLCTRIVNTKTNDVKTVPSPTYSFTSGMNLLGLNFELLQKTGSEYGYQGKCLEGLWISSFNIQSEKLETIIRASDIEKVLGKILSNDAVCNHILPHPTFEKFIFILRSFDQNKRRHDVLMHFDITTRMLKVIPTGQMVSHYTWVDNNRILAYAKDLNEREGFYLINTDNHAIVKVPELDIIPGDGHPQYHLGKIVVDSYPDFRGLTGLWIFDFPFNGQHSLMAKVRHSSRFSGKKRCDLHPRWSRDGKSIYFDSVLRGQRELWEIHLD